MARLRPGTRVLDLACGTGDLTCAAARSGARAIGLDITARMIELARRKATAVGPPVHQPGFVIGDMLDLPFPDACFDVITTGYGIRNTPTIEKALAEIARVLKPGGRMLSLDFDRPAHPLIWLLYYGYLTVVGSLLGLLLHGDPDTYRYIPESIRGYVGAAGVSRLMRTRGFEEVSIVPLLGGLMAINLGSRRA
jgi:ubiquinone/menaquinone biosynthesis methyltransferase